MEAKFTFHPVGQGLFYSGQIKDDNGKSFNFVYDCGSRSLTKVNKCIDNYHSFNQTKIIDLVVLSHLHADHINGIEFIVKKGYIIKKLIIPYVSKIQRLFLALSANNQNGWYYNFLANQEDSFGDEITWIEVFNDETQKNYNKRIKNWNWEFIFYNKPIDDIYFSGFMQKIEAINNFKSLSDKEIIKIISDTEKRKKFKSAYNFLKPELDENINNSSIMLFHSPSFTNAKISNKRHNFAGQLLTGDICMRDCYLENISKYFENYIQNTMIFQIPHHGSIKNWSNEIMTKFNNLQVCFSCGMHKGWGHPSPKIENTIKENKISYVNANEYILVYGFEKIDESYRHFILTKKLERILEEKTDYDLVDLFNGILKKK